LTGFVTLSKARPNSLPAKELKYIHQNHDQNLNPKRTRNQKPATILPRTPEPDTAIALAKNQDQNPDRNIIAKTLEQHRTSHRNSRTTEREAIRRNQIRPRLWGIDLTPKERYAQTPNTVNAIGAT
jgi:hypothetical protein